MSDTRYNGWSNYETWVVNLWIDNDEGSYNYWCERARECFIDAASDGEGKEQAATVLAQALENEHDENAPKLTGAFADLFSHALGMVNWYEIAASQIDALDIVSCAQCGKQMLDDDAVYNKTDATRSGAWCEACTDEADAADEEDTEDELEPA
jgi:hypothetical protein